MANILAYSRTDIIMAVKSFIIQGPENVKYPLNRGLYVWQTL